MKLPSFYGLDGVGLERWFTDFFRTQLQLNSYFPTPGQIKLELLNPGFEKGQHLELDGILRIHKTGILFEYTAQKGDFRDKIKKFLRNCHLFINEKHLTLKQKFELFEIPAAAMDDFEDIEEWKFVYFGTSPAMDLKRYSKGDFPEYKELAEHLYIFQPSQLEYLRQLSNSIGKFATNELLALLNFQSEGLGDEDGHFELDYIKADGKYIAGDSEVKADLYLLKFKVTQLLRIARVSRFDGIPFIMEDKKTGPNYQRLLIDQKLAGIATDFIGDNKKKMFPNTITLALSEDCKESGNGKLQIPKRFSSIDIIDGQHRLFGYTQSNITDEVRDNAEILATAIRFRTGDDDAESINKCAARVFCEVNSTQAKVSADLLYLIKYDVLGDRDYGAAAGKILLECDKKDSAMAGIFAVNTLKRNNALNRPSIAIVHVIEQELIPLLKGEGHGNFKLPEKDLSKLFDDKIYDRHPGEYVTKAIQFMERYFNDIRSVFKEDWAPNVDTLLFNENLIQGLLRFYRFHVYNQGVDHKQMRDILVELKERLQASQSEDPLSFSVHDSNIPKINATVDEVFNFLTSFKPDNLIVAASVEPVAE